jgi:hypothetical protein
MMMISSVVLSIFASWGLQNDNGEDNSDAHARSSPQVRGVARISGRPLMVMHSGSPSKFL